jgi:ankyrin repeat protein
MGTNTIVLVFCIILFYTCENTKYVYAFDFKLFNNSSLQLLSKLVEIEDTGRINELLKNKSINVDYQEPKFGHSLLMLAVANNKSKSVEVLLKNNANPNLTSKNNEDNSISIAAENYSNVCDTIILHLLTRYKGDLSFIQNINRIEDNGMHSITNRTILMIAVRNDCFAISKFIIDKGVDLNKYTYYEGYGAITESIIQNNLKITKYLIINKNAIIPRYIFKRHINSNYKGDLVKYLTITDLLKEQNYDKETENYKIRNEIISYLQSKNLK